MAVKFVRVMMFHLSTLSADMCLLGVDPRDVQDRVKWRAMELPCLVLTRHEIGHMRKNLKFVNSPKGPGKARHT